ncbi:MAG: beta galactosidase jelly roll domain-containing protein, partial [Ramlibacter sp.]
NNGGQYGERMGWHLPRFDDRSWGDTKLPEAAAMPPGTNWYRTRFDLSVPEGQDATIGIAIASLKAELDPLPDLTHSPETKRHLATVLAKRLLGAAHASRSAITA